MTESSIAFSNEPASDVAGQAIARELRRGLSGRPDAVIVFSSSRHDYAALLGAIEQECSPGTLIGCSSAGEFTKRDRAEGAVSAIALRSSTMKFTAGLGRSLRSDRRAAAESMARQFSGASETGYRYRTALVLTDALAGFTDDFIEQLSLATLGDYQFFGGGAGDDARFSRTHVFFGTEAVTDAAVALEILSHKPIGIGVSHGWVPASDPLRVTEATGTTLISLNAQPAADVFASYAEATNQRFDRDDPVPFFLHNVLGIETPAGYKLRVPLLVQPDGSAICASDVPQGSVVRIMKTSAASASDAAIAAVGSALTQMGDARPEIALFFDCVATRLRMGDDFGFEVRAVENALGNVPFAGCNTYGQIARSLGQFSGFHNCTATVAVLPS